MKMLGGGVWIHPKVPLCSGCGVSAVIDRAAHDGDGAEARGSLAMGCLESSKVGDRSSNDQLQIVVGG